MRTVFDATPLLASSRSGIGYYTHELIASLAAQNTKDTYTGYYFNFLGKRKVHDLPSGANITYLATRIAPGKILGGARKFGVQIPLLFLAPTKCDVILFTNYVSLPSPKRAKKVVFVYDLCFLDYPEYVQDKNRAFLQKWLPRSIQSADLIITISEFTKERIMHHYDISEDKIHITPIPPHHTVSEADTSIYSPAIQPDKYILFVGTIEPRKNISGLLDEYKAYCEGTPDPLSLVLAGGKGWHDESIRQTIHGMQRDGLKVITPGYVSDAQKTALYNGARLCIMPSHYEGFGMPVLEAMSYGKPVVCSDIPVFREISKDAVLYFNKDKAGDLSQLLRNVQDDTLLLADLAKKSREFISNYPTWDDIASCVRSRIDDLF